MSPKYRRILFHSFFQSWHCLGGGGKRDMAVSGARALLRLPKNKLSLRLCPVSYSCRGTWRDASSLLSVTLPENCCAGPLILRAPIHLRKRGNGVGGVLMLRESKRGLTSGTVSFLEDVLHAHAVCAPHNIRELFVPFIDWNGTNQNFV